MIQTVQDGVGSCCALLSILNPVEIFMITDVEEIAVLEPEKEKENHGKGSIQRSETLF